jgi:hypothetical protein
MSTDFSALQDLCNEFFKFSISFEVCASRASAAVYSTVALFSKPDK